MNNEPETGIGQNVKRAVTARLLLWAIIEALIAGGVGYFIGTRT